MIFLAFLLLVGFSVQAQMQISGTVTGAEDGLSIPGVSVVVKNNPTIGTTTDMDGKYTLTVPGSAEVLLFSFVGMKTQEVTINGRSLIDIQLEAEVLEMDEVIVTAIGIKREAKKIGYSVTNVNGEEVTKTQTTDAMTSLQGRVAGVDISSNSGAPSASTKVILRGYSSVTGNNQPLYVVDGSPINNETAITNGADDVNNAVDLGNAASDINPSDIESMTILKGAAATALYGSRAANGVIMITTKSGKKNEKLKVNFSSSLTYSEPLRVPQLQNKFGQGWSGDWASAENGSWGPVMDGKERLWGYVVDNSQLLKPFEAQENNLRDFYDLGTSYNNTISLSGGGEKTSFYASYTNVNTDGFIPTDVDQYKRNNVSFRGTADGERLSAKVALNYVNKNTGFASAGQGGDKGATLFQELIQMPRDMSIVDMKDYQNKYYNVDNFFTLYAWNPYRVLAENRNDYNEDRIYGNMELGLDIIEGLQLMWRIGADVKNGQLKQWSAIAQPSPTSNNASKTGHPGSVDELSFYTNEINSDLTLVYNKDFMESLNLNVIGGWNVYERNYKRQWSYIRSIDIPYFYNLSNTSENQQTFIREENKRLYAFFGQIDLSYNDYLFATFTARNDWSSTLPEDNNSFFYPGATIGFIASEAFPSIKKFAPFVKVRASWGQTGNDARPYLINPYFIQGSAGLNFGDVNLPLNGVNGFEIGNTLGNANLQPEITTEYEFGIDLRLLNNRIALDIAYYNRKTTDQIFAVAMASSSGYTSQTMNFGEVENKGVEALLTITPVKTKDFRWDLTTNYTKNKNEVLELPEGLDKVVINQAYGIEFIAEVGKPMGVFIGHQPLTDPDGHIIVNSNGIPVNNPEKVEYGTAERDFTMGFLNSFSYKNIGLSFNIDWRKGGLMYSYTSRLNYFVGHSTNTMYNERRPWIIPNSVVGNDTDGDGEYDSYSENTNAVDMSEVNSYWNQTNNNMISQYQVLDKSYLKLRDVTITYDIPKRFIDKLPISKLSVGAYGRNLLIWTPEENNFIDPESTTFGNDLTGEFGEFAGGPSARTYGFNLRVSF